jgi:hypothetical protein
MSRFGVHNRKEERKSSMSEPGLKLSLFWASFAIKKLL